MGNVQFWRDKHFKTMWNYYRRLMAQGWCSKRVVLADVPPERQSEPGYIRMFPQNANRNANRNEGTFACSHRTKTGTRAHSPKPPFCLPEPPFDITTPKRHLAPFRACKGEGGFWGPLRKLARDIAFWGGNARQNAKVAAMLVRFGLDGPFWSLPSRFRWTRFALDPILPRRRQYHLEEPKCVPKTDWHQSVCLLICFHWQKNHFRKLPSWYPITLSSTPLCVSWESTQVY